MEFKFNSQTPKETVELGAKLGKQLRGGEVIGVYGPLGSGKTCLIKGIGAGTGMQDSLRGVNSPTFVIVNQYEGRPGSHFAKNRKMESLDIYHIDAYRLRSLQEFEMLGFDDYCYDSSVVVIEWADRVEEALNGIDFIRIELAYMGRQSRGVSIFNLPSYIRL